MPPVRVATATSAHLGVQRHRPTAKIPISVAAQAQAARAGRALSFCPNTPMVWRM